MTITREQLESDVKELLSDYEEDISDHKDDDEEELQEFIISIQEEIFDSLYEKYSSENLEERPNIDSMVIYDMVYDAVKEQ